MTDREYSPKAIHPNKKQVLCVCVCVCVCVCFCCNGNARAKGVEMQRSRQASANDELRPTEDALGRVWQHMHSVHSALIEPCQSLDKPLVKRVSIKR